MKIFEFQSEGENDYVVADGMFDAIKWYLEDTDNDFGILDNVSEVPKETWDKLAIVQHDTGCTANITFAQAIEDDERMPPYILASTAY